MSLPFRLSGFIVAGLMVWCGLISQSALRAEAPVLLVPRGDIDMTEEFAAALKAGPGEIVLGPGKYRIGTVDVPPQIHLRAMPGAKIVINPKKLRTYSSQPPSPANPRCVFALKGNQIHFEGLDFDFSLTEDKSLRPEERPEAIFAGEGFENLWFSKIRAIRPEPVAPLPLAERKGERYPKLPSNQVAFDLVQLRNCRDIILEDSRAEQMLNVLDLFQCSRVISRYNQAVSCNSITCLRSGDEFLWHIGNWSRDVRHQCRWWGGNANDKRNLKPGDPGWKTGSQVVRGPKEGDKEYNRFTAGTFDVFISNNYAEYGRILAWGSKGRNVIFTGNSARFMTDYVMGSEGGENIIFNGNITANGNTCGIAAYYWTEKLVVNGNTVLVNNDPPDPQWTWFAKPESYHGGLMRLHALAGRGNLETGAGQVVISGNLFSNELNDRLRSIRIEAGRDVLFSDNKIRNGRIVTKSGSREIVIRNNEFFASGTSDWPCIDIQPGIERAVIQNNSFRAGSTPIPSVDPQPAMVVEAAGTSKSLLRLIEGNNSEGFPRSLIALAKSTGTNDRFIIQNNQFDSPMITQKVGEKALFLIQDNIDLKTLQAYQPAITQWVKPKKGEPQKTEEEKPDPETTLPGETDFP